MKARDVGAGAGAGEQADEVAPGDGGEAPVQHRRLGLDDRLQRGGHRVVRHDRRAVAARAQAGQRALLDAHPDLDRRAGVLGGELADLPLPGELPQRVVQPGGQAVGEVEALRARFQSGPGGDRRHVRPPSLG